MAGQIAAARQLREKLDAENNQGKTLELQHVKEIQRIDPKCIYMQRYLTLDSCMDTDAQMHRHVAIHALQR